MIRLLKSVIGVVERYWITLRSLLELRKEKNIVPVSYFPEYISQRKSAKTIYKEQRNYIIKYSRPNPFYYLYGFDIKGLRDPNDYVDYLTVFREVRDAKNKTPYSPFIVLRDKSLFGIVAEAYGIKTPKNLGIIQNGYIYIFDDKKTVPVSQITSFPHFYKTSERLFVKQIDGECADGVFRITIDNSNKSIIYQDKPINLDLFLDNDKRYLVQEAIPNQHPAISAIYSKAINTLRVCTVYNKVNKDIELLSCVLRVGTGDSNVDNWAAGGLSIGIDEEKGTLREYGFFKPGFGTKVKEHPNSHIVFKDYPVPFMNEAIQQAKEFHRRLYGLHSIGWDIAITDEGPCFVEGNDNWEISLMQISNHGLQKEFNRLF